MMLRIKQMQLLVNALKSYPRFLSVPESFLVSGPVPVFVVLQSKMFIVGYFMCEPAVERFA